MLRKRFRTCIDLAKPAAGSAKTKAKTDPAANAK
jgi:hypothetical protein